jgi:hypothetical protein
MTKTNTAAQQELKLEVESSSQLCQAVTWPRPDLHRGDRGWIPLQTIWICAGLSGSVTGCSQNAPGFPPPPPPTPASPNRSNIPIEFFHHRRCIILANYSVVTYDTKKIIWSKFETFVLPSCCVARGWLTDVSRRRVGPETSVTN